MKIAKQSVEYLYGYGNDLDVVNAARVSFDKLSEWEVTPEQYGDWEYIPEKLTLSERDAKLIAYLAKHKHWTPFGHVGATFRVKAPIFVARQLVKHQVGLVWNEVSRRYVDSEPEFYFPEAWRARAESAKQGSGERLDLVEQVSLSADLGEATQTALLYYSALLSAGVAPEQARMILPQNTMTEWVWTGSLAAWSRVCTLRLDPHAQEETREIAQKISVHMETKFPVSWKALMENTWSN